ncbi:Ethanolamine ammonia lyase large subunit, partial [Pseudomonas coronafaciens pv. garcae]
MDPPLTPTKSHLRPEWSINCLHRFPQSFELGRHRFGRKTTFDASSATSWRICMASFSHSVGAQTYRFDSLKEVMAKASPARSGDYLAEVAAQNDGERVAAQMALANIPLTHFLQEALIPYEQDEVTRLIIDTHDKAAFAPVSHLTI